MTTISQMTWTGVRVTANGHLDRCADRAGLAWLESRLSEDVPGCLPGLLAGTSSLRAAASALSRRGAGLDLGLRAPPGIALLLAALDRRESFLANPVWWWDEGPVWLRRRYVRSMTRNRPADRAVDHVPER
ncbi:MAG: hypothetical protein M9905_18810 [Rhizobiaceae bacterium]|nr:hypothetical protein [Rhizobiaceae bacterium]